MENIRLIKHTMGFILLSFFIVVFAFAQQLDPTLEPLPSEMNQWDQAIISFYEILIYAGAIATFIVGLAVPFLGKKYWWPTRPIARLFIVSGIILVGLEILILNIPTLIENNFIQGASPKYIEFIQKVTFEASGLFNGKINPGVPAVAWSQILTVAAIMLFSVILGAVLAYLTLRILRARR